MDDRRALKRWHLIYYLRVFDVETDSLLGHVIDIHTGGLSIGGEWPLPQNKSFQLRMTLPGDGDEPETVSIHARCVWSQEDEERPRFYRSGFSLIQPNPRTVQTIGELISSLES